MQMDLFISGAIW